MKTPVIPTTYNQWQHCITKECGISLDSAYIASRIQTLENMSNEQTRQFLRQYGSAHHTRILQWFRQAQGELQ